MSEKDTENTKETTDTEEKNERLWEKEAEMLQDMYDSMPQDMRVRYPKPKGYHKPDMDFPRKGIKPRHRQKRWKKGIK